MNDDNSMSERILRTLENIFKGDRELRTFTIIPTEENTKNKSPVHYEEHDLGLESWCVKHIYKYAYKELFAVRQGLNRRKLDYEKEANLNHLLIGALLINPDVSTFWNMKRELVENDTLSIGGELLFSRIILTHRCKSNETFGYRRWLLKRVLAKVAPGDQWTAREMLQNELQVCEMAAGKMLNNYHAWSHRIWCMENVAARTTGDMTNIVSSELTFTHDWLSSHVSEHIGYHYREYIIKMLRTNKNVTGVLEQYYSQTVKDLGLVNNERDPRSLLVVLLGKQKFQSHPAEEGNKFVNYLSVLLFDLFNIVELWNAVFPNHESLWYHRRFLIYHLVKAAYDYHDTPLRPHIKIDDTSLRVGAIAEENIVNCDHLFSKYQEREPKMLKRQPNKVETSLLYQTLLKTEGDCVKRCANSGDVERELAKKYEKWLKFVLSFELAS